MVKCNNVPFLASFNRQADSQVGRQTKLSFRKSFRHNIIDGLLSQVNDKILCKLLTFGVRAVITDGVKTPGILAKKLVYPITKAEYLQEI